MSNEIKDGGPAFPVEHYTQSRYESTGMTLRDYFAAKWLQGFVANPSDTVLGPEDAAEFAYKVADAMLAARKEQA